MVLGENMKERGFTLVELLAVIVILSLIALIAVPAITGIIKESKDTLSDAQLNNVILAAKNWASDVKNVSKLPAEDGDSVCIHLSELQAGGYADLEIKNPKTGKDMEVSVKVIRTGKNLDFQAVAGPACP